jgi:UPF0176 protein
MNIVIAALYHFFDFPDFASRRQPILEELKRLSIKGSLLIASEGINGTLAGTRTAIDEFLTFLKTHVTHAPFEHKESLCDRQPFKRTKVRLKKETISLGVRTDPRNAGIYVDARAWNALLDDPDTVLLDARNDYEVHLGTFEGALNPGIRTFKELPEFVSRTLASAKRKKIATFCTGGIRCEKLTAWMIEQGFEEVYHLKGGILKYLEEMPEDKSKWHGECYVFDERIAVSHGLAPSHTASMCEACGHSLTSADRTHPKYVQGRSCHNCHDYNSVAA